MFRCNFVIFFFFFFLSISYPSTNCIGLHCLPTKCHTLFIFSQVLICVCIKDFNAIIICFFCLHTEQLQTIFEWFEAYFLPPHLSVFIHFFSSVLLQTVEALQICTSIRLCVVYYNEMKWQRLCRMEENEKIVGKISDFVFLDKNVYSLRRLFQNIIKFASWNNKIK